jgi:hypothetical protein
VEDLSGVEDKQRMSGGHRVIQLFLKFRNTHHCGITVVIIVCNRYLRAWDYKEPHLRFQQHTSVFELFAIPFPLLHTYIVLLGHIRLSLIVLVHTEFENDR